MTSSLSRCYAVVTKRVTGVETVAACFVVVLGVAFSLLTVEIVNDAMVPRAGGAQRRQPDRTDADRTRPERCALV